MTEQGKQKRGFWASIHYGIDNFTKAMIAIISSAGIIYGAWVATHSQIFGGEEPKVEITEPVETATDGVVTQPVIVAVPETIRVSVPLVVEEFYEEHSEIDHEGEAYITESKIIADEFGDSLYVESWSDGITDSIYLDELEPYFDDGQYQQISY